jgi:hypothetical protein
MSGCGWAVSAPGVNEPRCGISPCAVTANIVLNALVVVRLLWMSRRAKKFAISESSKMYMSIAAMV